MPAAADVALVRGHGGAAPAGRVHQRDRARLRLARVALLGRAGGPPPREEGGAVGQGRGRDRRRPAIAARHGDRSSARVASGAARRGPRTARRGGLHPQRRHARHDAGPDLRGRRLRLPAPGHGPRTVDQRRGLPDARGALPGRARRVAPRSPGSPSSRPDRRALTREHERVAVVLLDAFGWAFVRASRRPPVPATAGDRAGRLAVPVDHHRAPDDALQRAAGRASTGSTSGAATSRRLDTSSGRCRSCSARRRRCRWITPQSCARGRRCSSSSTAVDWSCSRRRSPTGRTARPASPGAHGRAVRDASSRRPRCSGRARADLLVLGRDRRRRAPPRALERTPSTPRLAPRSTRSTASATRPARHRRPRPDRRGRARDYLDDALAPAARAPHAGDARGLGARLLPARRRPRDASSRSFRRGSATAPRSATRPSSSRTPDRACAPGSPTSASSPRPAGWSGCARFPSPRAALQGPPRRPHAGGMETWVGIDLTHGDRRQLHEARSRHRRALPLAAARAGRDDLRHQPDPAAARPARAHPPAPSPGGGLPRAPRAR